MNEEVIGNREEVREEKLGFYGCYFHEDNSFHEHYYGKYESRSKSLIILMEDLKDAIEDGYPEIKDKNILKLNYQNIFVSVGRYFNDVVKYKCWHKIPLTHKSKVAAHMIKWIRLSPFFSFSVSEADWMQFDEDTRTFLLGINSFVLVTILGYIAEAFNVVISNDKFNQIHVDLDYYVTTDSYNERMAILWFQEVLK
jgi:acyl carrier protein